VCDAPHFTYVFTNALLDDVKETFAISLEIQLGCQGTGGTIDNGFSLTTLDPCVLNSFANVDHAELSVSQIPEPVSAGRYELWKT
jgi:hypothetical protein